MEGPRLHDILAFDRRIGVELETIERNTGPHSQSKTIFTRAPLVVVNHFPSITRRDLFFQSGTQCLRTVAGQVEGRDIPVFIHAGIFHHEAQIAGQIRIGYGLHIAVVKLTRKFTAVSPGIIDGSQIAELYINPSQKLSRERDARPILFKLRTSVVKIRLSCGHERKTCHCRQGKGRKDLQEMYQLVVKKR